MGQAAKPAVPVTGLQPGVDLYLFATAVDVRTNESCASPPRKVRLRDEFPMK